MLDGTEHWHDDIPGARWFRADLQVHTLDDHPGGRVRPQPGPDVDESAAKAHATALLEAAVCAEVQVLGLTPHAVRCGGDGSASCLWETLTLWKDGQDSTGVDYRSRIYAVYGGFEVSVHDGRKGVHLAFLFDPDISRDLLFQAHAAATGNRAPWKGSRLEVSRRSASEVFAELDAVFKHEGTGPHYLCYTPHSFGENGVFRETDTQIRKELPWDRIAALDLGRNRLSSEEQTGRRWFREGVNDYRLALIHTSDSYQAVAGSLSTDGIGSRFSFLKLARPSIGALRQAFLAAESRVACPYTRNQDGKLELRPDLPDPLAGGQPWLREVCPLSSSFFRDPPKNGGEGPKIRFNPGLTCVIGGRMSGKSTLLDGLRAASNTPLPTASDVARDVQARAELFVGGGEPTLEYAGTAAGDRADWAAQFFTQRELQLAVTDQGKLGAIIYNVSDGESEGLASRSKRLEEIDELLSAGAQQRASIRADLVDGRQELAQANAAAAALRRFKDVGADRIELAQARASIARARRSGAAEARSALPAAMDTGVSTPLPSSPTGLEDLSRELRARLVTAEQAFAEATASLETALAQLVEIWSGVAEHLDRQVAALRREVVTALIKRGGTPEDIEKFDQHRRNSAQLESLRGDVTRFEALDESEKASFEELLRERDRLIAQQRDAFNRVSAFISARFGGEIRIAFHEEGDVDQLDAWVREIAQRGVTRWWNGVRESGTAPGSTALRKAYAGDSLAELGMSGDVSESFKRILTEEHKYRLAALRCPDTFSIEWRVGEGYRPIDRLSGGQQVSVLLSLLLETDDNAPLVIDQPEDELDNAYLMSTVLPRLRQLKGRRQVIFATHSANIVVNGDADQVVCLRADSEGGWVQASGAIEDPEVMREILETLDGGKAAFSLRRQKYGF